MKKPSRFLRVLGIAGLLVSLLAATIAPVAAQEDDDNLPDLDGLEALFDVANAGFRSGDNTIYYPWVANGENFGLGDSRTSISVQNLEDRSTTIAIFVGTGDGFELETTAFLSPFAAKTFSAAQLNIEEGSGAPVAVVSFNVSEDDLLFPDVVAGSILTETVVLLSKPDNVTGDFTQVNACVVNASSAASNPGFGVPVGFVVAADFTFEGVDYSADDDDDATDENSVFVGSFTQDDLQDILEDANSGGGDLVNPFGGLVNDADCNDIRVAGRVGGSAGTPGVISSFDSVAIGGVAKQAVEGENLPSTSSADTAVSGYNALNGAEVDRFNQWYLPIVQTNCGPGGCWNSIIRVANIINANSAVTVRFFPHDDAQGSLDTGFQVQELVDAGETIDIDLSSLVPEGYIGSAHILTDGRVVTMVDRYKVGYDMWITNSGSSADFEAGGAQVPNANGRYALFAPHVLIDYFGWNTGINVANLVDEDNNVSIQYFNLLGNATQVLNQRIAAHGMTYFYDPSQAPQDNNNQDVTSDVNAGVVGSAIIWSDAPVAAAIDATKYPESDPNGGEDLFQATSYSATANVFTFQAVPLVQKGNPTDGMGDTSGINIMNPNSEAATANVFWVNPSGFLADNFGTSSVTIPGFANGFVYTLTQRNLPNGFTGAAQVVSDIPVAAVSANVNYQVDGDGSAIFNAFNPCGFFRVSGECSFGDPFEPGGQSVTKSFVASTDDDGDGDVDADDIDDDDAGVAGVNFSIIRTDGGAGFQRDGVSGTDGERTFSNIPVGTYDLVVNSVPAGFVLPTGVQDTFVVTEGDDVSLTNVLEFNQGFTKTVIVAGSGTDGDDDDDVIDAGVGLGGVDVVVFENIGADFLGAPVTGDIVFEGQTDANGQVSGNLPSGNYLLCLFDTDGVATVSDDDNDDTNNEEVNVDLLDDVMTTLTCNFDFDGDNFSVEDGVTTPLLNEVFLNDGVLNVRVFDSVATDTGGVEDQVGQEGVEVCLDGVTCANTNADGFASFVGVQNSASAGSYDITIDTTDLVIDDIFGGDLTVTVNSENVVAGSANVDYDPTLDVAQDGVLNDTATSGSADLNFQITGGDVAARVVSPDNLQGGQIQEEGGTISFVTGPGAPPAGDGSLEFSIGADGSDGAQFRLTTFDGVRLDALTALTYNTYVDNNVNSQAPYVILSIDNDGDGVQDDSLFFEPVYQDGTYGYTGTPGTTQGPVALDVWQEWDVLGGGVWSLDDGNFGPPIETIDNYLIDNPNATIVASGTGQGGLRLVAGYGAGAWDNFLGNVDLLTVGVEGTTFTYDFEP